MRLDEANWLFAHSTTVLFIVALTLMCFGLFADPVEILKTFGFPVSKLYGDRGQTDLVILRIVTLLVSISIIASQILLGKNPDVFTKLATAIKDFISVATTLPLFTPLFLGAVMLVKTVLQLSLYLLGYRAYAGDDFSRALKADDWFQHVMSNFDLTAWLNLGRAQLPFPDYLFGLALALYRDVYVTPKIVNLLLSCIVVVVAYLLGRELFGRAAGLFTAVVCAFQPWIIWLGLSGMTSDLPSVIMISLFGLFLLRWLETNHSASLLAAAGCLFVAAGFRYENWFFSVVFSLFLVCRFISVMRTGGATLRSATLFVGALAIASACPIAYMAASYYVCGDLLPALRHSVISNAYFSWPNSVKGVTGTSGPKINMVLLALSAFPLEICAAVAGIVLFLRSDGRKPPRLYLLVIAITFLLFAIAFKGRLPAQGGGPERILLPYVILLLPYAGFLLTQAFRASGLGRPVYAVSAGLLLLTLGIFDFTRAFNYPAKKYNREAFAAGWTLRMLQEIETIPQDGRIIIEKSEQYLPYPIMAVANRSERFVRLDDGTVGKACNGGLQTEACKKQVLDGNFNMIILSSPEKIRTFQQIFSGRSWQIGKYHIFEVKTFTKDSQRIDPNSNLSRSR